MAIKTEDYAARRQALQDLVHHAARGALAPLFDRLARGSGLPGHRVNTSLLDEFGAAVALEDKGEMGRLLVTMARFNPEIARGGTAFEVVPICGVRGLGEWASRHASAVPQAVDVLHACADDVRYRVRKEVPRALACIGEKQGDALLPLMIAWMDGLFHASAVLRAIADQRWQVNLHAVTEVVDLLDKAFGLADEVPRSAMRSPGYKDLLEALAFVPAEVAQRFGVIVLDRLSAWSATKEPKLRDAVLENLKSTRLIARHSADVEKIRQAFDLTAPARRDPKTYVGPTRSRGKKPSRKG